MTSNEKRIATTLSKYNVSNVAYLPEIQKKRRQSFDARRTTIFFYQEPRVNMIEDSSLSVYKINKDIADDWLNTYHPFKAPRGNVLCLGLVKNDVIYCMMTFKKSRDKNYSAELSRMWMLPTYNVENGYQILSEEASKLGVYDIISYVNMSFENYKDYESIGMKYVRDIQRTKWWVKDDQRMSDASRRQYKYKQEDLLEKGWLPVYDCGQAVYVTQ